MMESDVYNSNKQGRKYLVDDPITQPVMTKASVKFPQYPFQFVTFRETVRMKAARANNIPPRGESHKLFSGEQKEESVLSSKKKLDAENGSVGHSSHFVIVKKPKKKNGSVSNLLSLKGSLNDEKVDNMDAHLDKHKGKRKIEGTLNCTPLSEEKTISGSLGLNEICTESPKKRLDKHSASPKKKQKQSSFDESTVSPNKRKRKNLKDGEIMENKDEDQNHTAEILSLQKNGIFNKLNRNTLVKKRNQKMLTLQKQSIEEQVSPSRKKNCEDHASLTHEENVCPLTGEIEENCALSFLTNKSSGEGISACDNLYVHVSKRKKKVNEENSLTPSMKLLKEYNKKRKDTEDIVTSDEERFFPLRKKIEVVSLSLTRVQKRKRSSNEKKNEMLLAGEENEENVCSLRGPSLLTDKNGEEKGEECCSNENRNEENKELLPTGEESGLLRSKEKNEEILANNHENNLVNVPHPEEDKQIQPNEELLSRKEESGNIPPSTEEEENCQNRNEENINSCANVNKDPDLHLKKTQELTETNSEQSNVCAVQIEHQVLNETNNEEDILSPRKKPEEKKNCEEVDLQSSNEKQNNDIALEESSEETSDKKEENKRSRRERSMSSDFSISSQNLNASEASWLAKINREKSKQKEETCEDGENVEDRHIRSIEPKKSEEIVKSPRTTEKIVLLLKQYMTKLNMKTSPTTFDQKETPGNCVETAPIQNEDINEEFIDKEKKALDSEEPANSTLQGSIAVEPTENEETQDEESDEETEEDSSEDTSAEESSDEDEVSKDTIKKLETLSITIPWEVPKLHTIETRVSTVPKPEQREEMKRLEIQIKSGIFNKAEDERIRSNWEEFCRLHNLPQNPAPFADFSCFKGVPVLPTLERIKFVRFLAHGLDNRLLHSVYKRFQKLFSDQNIKSGRFTEEEDRIIRKFMEKTTSKTPHFELAKILNRDRGSVYRRTKKLKGGVKEQHVNWNKKSIKRFLKYCLKVTQNSSIEELKNKKFSHEEWLQLSKKMKLPVGKLQFAWSRTIHPRVFIKKSVSWKRIKSGVIEILTDKEEDDWRNIKWGEIAQNFEGFTSYKLNTLFKRMVQVHVPEEKRKNLKDCLEYFSDFNIERRLRTHLLRKLEIGDKVLKKEDKEFKN